MTAFSQLIALAKRSRELGWNRPSPSATPRSCLLPPLSTCHTLRFATFNFIHYVQFIWKTHSSLRFSPIFPIFHLPLFCRCKKVENSLSASSLPRPILDSFFSFNSIFVFSSRFYYFFFYSGYSLAAIRPIVKWQLACGSSSCNASGSLN